MKSAFQQALQNITNLRNYSPQNISNQAQSFVPFVKTIPKTMEGKIVGALDKGMATMKQRDMERQLRLGDNREFVQPPSQNVAGVSTKVPSISPTAIPTRIPTATPTPMPDKPTKEELMAVIKRGSKGAPIGEYAQMLVDEQSKYPIFEKYPFLTVAQTHLESRGLRDFKEQPELVNRPKQAVGWGVFVPTYNPDSIDQALRDFVSAIGGRTAEGGFDEGQIHNSQIYEPFRQNGDLKWYANKYAGPISERNPNAGDIYASNLATVMNEYAAMLDEEMKARGGSYGTRY